MGDPAPEEIVSLARISICVAIRNEAQLKQEFQSAIRSGAELSLIREAVLQTYLFAGYAATINAFILLNEIHPDRDQFWSETQPSSLSAWRERGEVLCRQIYGSQYESLVHNMKQLHPDLADWMIVEGYGKVLSRPFLSPLVRELLIVGMTAALQVERQFYSHVRGALHAGASSKQIHSVLEQVQPYVARDVYGHYQLIVNGILRTE
jgi:alkylhydroperoxidase/carboxymuconolactone decarboxylase family protein YurZ